MLDTKIGQGKKAGPAAVAKTGFEAMLRSDGDVVAGWKNKLQSAMAAVTPSDMLAEQHHLPTSGGLSAHGTPVRSCSTMGFSLGTGTVRSQF